MTTSFGREQINQVISPYCQENDAGDAMRPASEHFVRAQQLGDPGIRELQSKTSDGEDDETDSEENVLGSL